MGGNVGDNEPYRAEKNARTYTPPPAVAIRSRQDVLHHATTRAANTLCSGVTVCSPLRVISLNAGGRENVST